jgi:hypothetical protein
MTAQGKRNRQRFRSFLGFDLVDGLNLPVTSTLQLLL